MAIALEISLEIFQAISFEIAIKISQVVFFFGNFFDSSILYESFGISEIKTDGRYRECNEEISEKCTKRIMEGVPLRINKFMNPIEMELLKDFSKGNKLPKEISKKLPKKFSQKFQKESPKQLLANPFR